MLVSLIVTTWNEAETVPQLLESIAAQTRAPDEVIVVDGGSTDGTVDILRAQATKLPLCIIYQPGANIAQGRNVAIRAATGDVICSTDAGVRLAPQWLAEITTLFHASEGAPDVVAGFFSPDPRSVFEIALAATTLPTLDNIRADRFLPSSRSVAFRKEAWAKVGGYPEWLDYCEDLVFDFALRAANCSFAFAPRATAYFRPRATLGAFFKQYYRYARGDGKANLWSKRHLIRYITYLIVLPLLLIVSTSNPLLALPVWILGALVFFYTPCKRLISLWTGLSLAERLAASVWVPVIRVIGDVAKMLGYPVGVWWRLHSHRGRGKQGT